MKQLINDGVSKTLEGVNLTNQAKEEKLTKKAVIEIHEVYLNGELLRTTKRNLNKEEAFKIVKRAGNLINNFDYVSKKNNNIIQHNFKIFESTKS